MRAKQESITTYQIPSWRDQVENDRKQTFLLMRAFQEQDQNSLLSVHVHVATLLPWVDSISNRN